MFFILFYVVFLGVYEMVFLPWWHLTSLLSESELERQKLEEECWGLREKKIGCRVKCLKTVSVESHLPCGEMCTLEWTLIWRKALGPRSLPDLHMAVLSCWRVLCGECPWCPALEVITVGFSLDAVASTKRMLEAAPADPSVGTGCLG